MREVHRDTTKKRTIHRGPITQPHHASALGRPAGEGELGAREVAGGGGEGRQGAGSGVRGDGMCLKSALTEHARAHHRAEDVAWKGEGEEGWGRSGGWGQLQG